MRFFYLVFGSLFSSPLFALEENVSHPDFALGSLLASLLLVIACIFVFAFLMKKTNLLKNGQGKSQIKLIATQPLTNKGRVQIIEVNDQHYLLGVTEQNITLLDKYAKPLISDEENKEKATTPFAMLLSKISNKTDA